jgi:hypothetical protein
MNTKQKILKHLLENKQEKFSIREIAKAINMDYKVTYQDVNKLAKEDMIIIEDRGNTKLCSFSGNFNGDVFIVETERKETLLKNKDFLVIFNRLNKINKQFILFMFGSQIKSTTSKNSDIDIMTIANDEEAKEIENEINLLPHKIHLTVFSYGEFIQMLKSKEFNVVSEAIKKNVILFGVEDYYRIKVNVGQK